MIQVLKLHDYQKMPWKNGLGSTFEIARQSSLAKGDFDWRVSMADVENDGDFSYFEGKKRIISTLSGAGMRLQIAKQSHVDVCARDLFSFDGELAVFCQLIDGPIRDLNLIYNAQKVRPRMQRMAGCEKQTVLSAAQDILIFNMADQLQISIHEKMYHLAAFECLKIANQDETLKIELPQDTAKDCCFIELFYSVDVFKNAKYIA
ncbi:HutD family protein [Acinetobacter sp. ANC 5579]|uniref:HutD/Ves family protein n=1 Tax=Acinetobacter amyesii TaxID=2942470 RepID=UPI00201B3B0B|nr:HutD family protein [Acinetobacter amyesii]MCL6233564.1 HutD family protein [Acinetobacter amyesii]MCL6233610.1 HutD family protein [Acinetobacter amyesii]MCL6241508.1 HutD family protein [Acinetobacter amyesii]